MSLGMFATWVLVGLLAGWLADFVMKREGWGLRWDITLGLVGSIGVSWILRAVGIVWGSSIFVGAVVAFIGAAIAIVAQRKIRPTEGPGEGKPAMWQWSLGAAALAVVLWMTFGPSQQPAATAAVIEDKTYTVTPASMKVKAGIVAGEVIGLKVTEKVEKGSDRIVSAAKLSGTLRLKNTSTNQTVRVVAGKIKYIDAQGQPIDLDVTRTQPTVKFAASGSERLDPGQEATESLDVDFPAEALKANKLKEIRLELVYLPSPYREETARFAVSIGEGK